MFCVFCGEKMEGNFVYCPNCGKQVVKTNSQQKFVSTTVNKLDLVKSTENNENDNIVSSFEAGFWTHISDNIKISKPVFFICCIVIFYIGTYLTIIPNTPEILALLLIVILLALNFYLISAYGRNLKSFFQLIAVVFFTTFTSTYVNYDYSAEEYIDEILGIGSIFDDVLFYALFLTVLTAICYYAVFKLHVAADEIREREIIEVSIESEEEKEARKESYKHVKGEGFIVWLKKELL